jgi:non-heme chloroperoxidase
VIVARHGAGRVVKAVLISLIPPTFMQSATNPDGVPKEVVDGIRNGTAYHRAQFYKDITIPFYAFNRPGAVVSEGIRENWWRQGMMGAATAHYQCVKVLSETEFYDDLKMIEIPVLVMHGEDDQICPFPTTGARSVKLLKHGTLKSYPGFHTACLPHMRIRSMLTCLRSSGLDHKDFGGSPSLRELPPSIQSVAPQTGPSQPERVAAWRL